MLRVSKGIKLSSKQGTYTTPSKPQETIREQDCEMLSPGHGAPSVVMTSYKLWLSATGVYKTVPINSQSWNTEELTGP